MAERSHSTVSRLVCVVEGHGEVEAIPALCTAIVAYLEAWTWRVDPAPIRHSRSMLVDERVSSPRRPARHDLLARIIEQAMVRRPDAVLVLCDADDDCAATWAASANDAIRKRCAGAAIMPVREFEAWLLAARVGGPAHGVRKIEAISDAKGELRRLVANYKPSSHQLALTRQIDVASLRRYSRSFDKFVRALAELFGAFDPNAAVRVTPVGSKRAKTRGRGRTQT